MELLVAGYTRLHATIGVLTRISWMVRLVIVQERFYVGELTAVELIRLLSLFQITRSRRHIPRRIKWN